MSLNELAKRCYEEAAANGWHEKPVAFGDCMSLIHLEVSEAYEEYRKGLKLDYTYYSCGSDAITSDKHTGEDCPLGKKERNGCKPEGIPTELADVLIRVLDACGMYGIDIEAAVEQKLAYNRTRGYRHGGKVV